MMVDLRQCPFCGAFDALIKTERSAMWIECRYCGARGPLVYSETSAAKAWNSRAVEAWDARAAELHSLHIKEE